MNISKKPLAIFYLGKNKATLFRAGADPLVVSFPSSVVNNLEVADKTKLEQIITNCITENELKPINIFILISKDILFEKEIKDIPLSLQNAETEKFLEMVPIHHILTKTYNFSNKTIIIAADRDLCVSVVNAFKENAFPVVGVLPIAILEEKFTHMKDHFDEKFALQKIENLKKYSLPLDLTVDEKTITTDVPSSKNLKFIGMVALFFLLLGFLGVQIYLQFLAPSTKQQQTNQFEAKPVFATPTASPSATIAPSNTPILQIIKH